MNFFKKLFSKEKKENLNQGLEKTRTGLFSKLARIVVGKSTIDDEVSSRIIGVFSLFNEFIRFNAIEVAVLAVKHNG